MADEKFPAALEERLAELAEARERLLALSEGDAGWLSLVACHERRRTAQIEEILGSTG